MAETVLDLEVIQTDTKTYKFTVTKDGAVEDISGDKLFFTVKNKLTDADSAAIISKTVTCPNNTASQAGIGYITLTSTDTNVASGNYSYDIKYQQGTSLRKTVVSGKYQVNKSATQRLT